MKASTYADILKLTKPPDRGRRDPMGYINERYRAYGSRDKPISSYGVILYTRNGLYGKPDNELLKINRKSTPIYLNTSYNGPIWFYICQQRHSYEYIEFMMYRLKDLSRVRFEMMSPDERKMLLTHDYDSLIDDVMYAVGKPAHREIFRRIRDTGVLKAAIDSARSSVISEPPWGFPKGRKHRGCGETDINCALREFNEETCISLGEIELVDHPYIEEIYQGTDRKWYRTVYIVCEAPKKIPIALKLCPVNAIRTHTISNEITAACWLTLSDAATKLSAIRSSILHKLSAHIMNGNVRYIRKPYVRM